MSRLTIEFFTVFANQGWQKTDVGIFSESESIDLWTDVSTRLHGQDSESKLGSAHAGQFKCRLLAKLSENGIPFEVGLGAKISSQRDFGKLFLMFEDPLVFVAAGANAAATVRLIKRLD